MTAKNNWFVRYEAELLRACDERVRLRQLEKASRETHLAQQASDRARETQERARCREKRNQPCGAKTRAGHACRRKGSGRGGRCPNHGGRSTGPRTEEGRARIAEAQRRRWAARKGVGASTETCQMILENPET
jgi:hypothetical protein